MLAVGTIVGFLHRDTITDYADTVKRLYTEAEALVAEASEEDFKRGQRSTAYADDGTVISVWERNRNACYVPLSGMPQTVTDAMICMEDKRFEKHHGVDHASLVRALIALGKNHGKVTQGGSTITMQLARTMYLTSEVSWQRKVKEIFIAKKLEEKFSKDQIMEFYLNNIYFGNGYYGIGSAAYGYFGKDVRELEPAQLVWLCAIPNNPTVYDPLTNMENTKKRTRLILEKMEQGGYLSKEEAEAAASAEVVLAEETPVEKNDYMETYTAYCAVRALMESTGFTFCYEFEDDAARRAYEENYAVCYENCKKLLYTEGYRIKTSLDPELQRKLQDAVDKELSDFTEMDERGVFTLQGAAVCLDNTTGNVKAIVGGRSQGYDFHSLNRAYQSFRQPGSSIKPLIVYTPAFERGYTPETVMTDAPIAGGPRNATGQYLGEVTLQYAVEESINTVAWKLFAELTPETGLSYLKEMEFSRIEPQDYMLPSALGGFTIGVSPLEMASGYLAIANGGVFRSPSCIVEIRDAEGAVLYRADRGGKAVYDGKAAEMMEEVLAGVMENGTGNPVKLNGVYCAGKTGTTNDCKDSWFVGYTKKYTTSVWVGYDIPRAMEGITGPSYSGFIWKDFMDKTYEMN